MKILLVEDEVKLSHAVAAALKRRGYAVDCAYDGPDGERLGLQEPYDAIVLDRLLPRRDGTEVCRNLRAAGVTAPIIFLTALDATSDRVEGLDLGADDYLVKPFALEELAARLRALLRRPPLQSEDVLRSGDLEVDTRAATVKAGGQEVFLTLREYGLLEYLLRRQGEAVDREELLEHVWDRNADSLSNVVDVHLKNLRKKLPKRHADRIRTVRGKGYRFDEPAL